MRCNLIKKPSTSALLIFVVLIICSVFSSSVFAANWFKLRGTEPGGTAHTLQVWGFLQPTFAHDYSEPINNTAVKAAAPLSGTLPVPGTLPPTRQQQDSFFLRRARLGIRGTMIPTSNAVDYFFLTEWGQNGTTLPDHDAVVLDASMTFNQMSRGRDDEGLHNLGARVRVGQFLFSQTSEALSHSTPGRRVHIWMPEATLAHALTRRVSDNGPGNFAGTKVNGARDQGIELFDFVEFGDPDSPYEFTYSMAIGNGDTIGQLNPDDNYRTYYWLSFAQLLDNTRGPRRHDWMVYGWYQNGDIRFNDDINGDGLPDSSQSVPSGGIHPVNGLGGTIDRAGTVGNALDKDYRQEYMGLGFEYFDKVGRSQLRVEVEYQVMKGLTFDGTTSPSAFFNKSNGLGLRYSPSSENTGYYADFGYDINYWWGGRKRSTINLRYDVLDRNVDNSAREVHFATTTFSWEYFFHKKARVTFSYQARDFNADERSGNAQINGNAVLEEVGDRVGLQVTYIFKNVALR